MRSLGFSVKVVRSLILVLLLFFVQFGRASGGGSDVRVDTGYEL